MAVGDFVVVGDYEGFLHLLRQADGTLVGRVNAGAALTSPPLVRGERLLLLNKDGDLRSFLLTVAAG